MFFITRGKRTKLNSDRCFVQTHECVTGNYTGCLQIELLMTTGLKFCWASITCQALTTQILTPPFWGILHMHKSRVREFKYLCQYTILSEPRVSWLQNSICHNAATWWFSSYFSLFLNSVQVCVGLHFGVSHTFSYCCFDSFRKLILVCTWILGSMTPDGSILTRCGLHTVRR